MASSDQPTFWQADDKAIIGKVFLMVGFFAVTMAIVAVVVSYIL